MTSLSDEILKFWFQECSNEDWFMANPEFDEWLRERFFDVNQQASSGDLDDWANDSKSCLSLIIVLDQFTRNLFRGTPKAFQNDELAIKWTKLSIDQNYLEMYNHEEIHFCLMPLVHSEQLSDHKLAEDLRIKFLSDHPRHDLVKKSWDNHQIPIIRFGRYPHRNEILGRDSTREELEFLKGPNSSW